MPRSFPSTTFPIYYHPINELNIVPVTDNIFKYTANNLEHSGSNTALYNAEIIEIAYFVITETGKNDQ
jgi:hypothetical protein